MVMNRSSMRAIEIWDARQLRQTVNVGYASRGCNAPSVA